MNSTRSLLPLLFIFLCVFIQPCSSRAADPDYLEITAPELKTMLEEKQCLLIHSLSKIEYEIQHIEDSINIPVVEMNTTDLLPNDKATPLIFYCMGKR